MFNTFTRLVAKICIIAHLNLVLAPNPMVYAMEPEDTVERSLTTPCTPLPSPDLPEEAPSYQRNYGLGDLLLLGSLFMGEDYFCPLLICTTVMKYCDFKQLGFLAFSFLFQMTQAVNQSFEVNGGQSRTIIYNDFRNIRYNNITAPYLIGEGIDPEQNYSVALWNTFPGYPYDSVIARIMENLINNIINTINSSIYNVTLIENLDKDGVYFYATSNNLQAFLTKFAYSLEIPMPVLQTFDFCNNTQGIDPFIIASRFFPDLTRAPTPPTPAPIYKHCTYDCIGDLASWEVISIAVGGAVGIGLICAAIIGLGKRFLYPDPTDESIEMNLIKVICAKDEEMPEYGVISAELERIEKQENQKSTTSKVIEKYKNSLGLDLFNLCKSITKEDSNYNEAIEIQVNCLHSMLTNNSQKNTFMSVSEERREDIAARYIEKYQNPLGENLFNLCNSITNKHSSYNDAVETQAACLPQMLTADATGTPFQDLFHQKLSLGTDEQRWEEIAWQYIQTVKQSLTKEQLFYVYNYIGPSHDGYVEAIAQQADSLDEGYKAGCASKLLLALVTCDHIQDVSWHYINKYTGADPKFLFILCDNVVDRNKTISQEDENPDTELKEVVVQGDTATQVDEGLNSQKENKTKLSRYDVSLSLQADLLQKILGKEPGTETSGNLCCVLINQELEKMLDSNRRQDLVMRLITQSNLPLEARIKLCDQIQKDHPQYARARIEKAQLIYGSINDPETKESESTSQVEHQAIERFQQAMLLLMELPNDQKAIEFRQDFREDYWGLVVGEALPKAVINPQTAEELDAFMLYAKERRKELQRLNGVTGI